MYSPKVKTTKCLFSVPFYVTVETNINKLVSDSSLGFWFDFCKKKGTRTWRSFKCSKRDLLFHTVENLKTFVMKSPTRLLSEYASSISNTFYLPYLLR